MDLSAYHRVFPSPGLAGHSILFSTRTAATLLVPDDLIGRIAAGTLDEEECATLGAHGFLVGSHEAERREMLGFLDDLVAMHRACKPLVVLNLDCNLACAYCFEGSRKGRHSLSEETAELILRHLRERALPGREELSVTFYGGEPLLSAERLCSLAAGMAALAADADVPFRFSLITNGTLLTRELVDRLRPLGLASASVTLDGPRETHDAARPYRSGAGSHDTIVRNLREIAGSLDLQIGGNFTRENHRVFPRLLDDLAAAGLTPAVVSQVRFDPVFQERPGTAPADFHGGCTSFDAPWLFEATVQLREEILQRGYRTGRVMPSRCMMDFPGEPVINWDGGIYGCPGLIGREPCKVGDVRPTHGPGPGRLSAAGAGQRPAPAARAWHNETCLACAYLPLCLGGCRYMNFLRTGSTAGVDCRKPYFDAVLERLVLQDVRYGVAS